MTAPEGPVNVTAVYNGEVAFAAIVTAVQLDSTTVATIPSNRKRTTLGVGEQVTLTLSPSSASPVSWWLAPSFGAGSLSASTGSTVTFTAGDTSADPTIYVMVGDSTSHQAECIQPFTVIPPSGVQFTKLSERHEQWTCSAGFHAQVTILPTMVSFYRTQISEMSCYPSAAQGCYALMSNDQHPRWSSWYTPSQDNRLSTSVDYVFSNIVRYPYSAGLFVWNIPWNYRVIGNSSDGYSFTYLDHVQTATDTGYCTMSKNGQSASFYPADPSVNWD
jgi:hypothetical protein